jgi:hypothetical protein
MDQQFHFKIETQKLEFHNQILLQNEFSQVNNHSLRIFNTEKN